MLFLSIYRLLGDLVGELRLVDEVLTDLLGEFLLIGEQLDGLAVFVYADATAGVQAVQQLELLEEFRIDPGVLHRQRLVQLHRNVFRFLERLPGAVAGFLDDGGGAVGRGGDGGHGLNAGTASVVPQALEAVDLLLPRGGVDDLHLRHDVLGASEVALRDRDDGRGRGADEPAQVAENLDARRGYGVQTLERVPQHGRRGGERAGVGGAVEHFAGQRGQRGQHLRRDLAPHALHTHAEQVERVVELLGLLGAFFAHGEPETACPVVHLGQGVAAAVEQRDHFRATLAKDLLSQRGLGRAVGIAGEPVGHVAQHVAHLAQRAVGGLDADAHGGERLVAVGHGPAKPRHAFL